MKKDKKPAKDQSKTPTQPDNQPSVTDSDQQPGHSPKNQPVQPEKSNQPDSSEQPSWPFNGSVSQVDTDAIDPDLVDVNSNLIDTHKTVSVQRVVPSKKTDTRRNAKSKTDVGGSGRAAKVKKKPPQPVLDDDVEHLTIPEELGILALRNAVVFPGTVIPLAIGRPRSQRLLSEVMGEGPSRPGEKILGVITQKDATVDYPGYNDLYKVGSVVTVLKQIKQSDGQKSYVVHGLVRFRIVEWLSDKPYLKARIQVIASETPATKATSALMTSVRHAAIRMVELSPNIPEEVMVILQNIDDPGALADFLAANINIAAEKKQELLETADIPERLRKLSVALAEQIELLEMSAKIQHQVSKSIDKTQREYFLQEQLKAIQSELGQTDQKSAEIAELLVKIETAKMPESIHAEALRELDRLKQIPTMSPEFSVLRNYIEWLCELPWAVSTQDKLNINSARRILNADHYDLVKIKKRILEFLAVRKLNPKGRSPILCFAGPPGVGKTSLGRSIARSMGRKFIRISLGGIRDEADIRGHRRTYIGALPGRVMQELRKCGSNNPVFMLDELDKIGQDFRGDPASALLEVLDPEQNYSFTDHFIDQPFDLSRVMFIGTANYMGTVPPALRDRMEVLELPGYTAAEKFTIAEKYLVPRQLTENGLAPDKFNIKPDALQVLIDSYTREAGVRELERQIAAVCRAYAVEIASNKRKSATVSARHLEKILGPARYESELALRTATPGVATGLAYTPVGGEILFVESTLMAGSGKLILTGQLGDVMKESAQAALSVIKSDAIRKKRTTKYQAELSRILANDEIMSKQDIHIHVPAGAVPKDGPSAGLAIYTSLASLFLDKSVRPEIAMTGEVTLRGLVLPIGGVKEKVLAARRAGIETVVLPERNRKDLIDLPKEVQRQMKFEFVRKVDKILEIALK
ncbi:MAG: endopeptidase La [Sedimentisphaerales bacterium]|nr:endopeptidase La [Sedimentisphaerales bacterium]